MVSFELTVDGVVTLPLFFSLSLIHTHLHLHTHTHTHTHTHLHTDISMVQDDEVGDGTTSVTVLACELLKVIPLLNWHLQGYSYKISSSQACVGVALTLCAHELEGSGGMLP